MAAIFRPRRLVLATGRHRKRVSRAARAVSAAAVVAVGGFGAGTWWAAGASGRAWHVERAAHSARGVHAALRWAPQPWGTAIQVQLSGLTPGTKCVVWVNEVVDRVQIQTVQVMHDDHVVHVLHVRHVEHLVVHHQAGAWLVTSRRDGNWYPVSWAARPGQIASVDVTAGPPGGRQDPETDTADKPAIWPAPVAGMSPRP